jgi:hypothetical protein
MEKCFQDIRWISEELWFYRMIIQKNEIYHTE